MDSPGDYRGLVPARISESERQERCGSSMISRTVMVKMTKQEAARLVRRMLGGFPSLNLHDPETYMATITAMLMGYSLKVGEQAIEKITATSKFVPAPAEVKEALEECRPKPTYADIWNERAQIQLDERDEIERQRLLAPPRKTKEEFFFDFYAEMEARGMHFKNRTVPHKETRASVMEKLKITPEQFDAIPDAPKNPKYWDGEREAPVVGETWKSIGEVLPS